MRMSKGKTAVEKQADAERAELERWREMWADSTVTVDPCGTRALIRRKLGGWLEVATARGAVVFLGDFSPTIIRDGRTRSLTGWMFQVAEYKKSLSYGGEKMEFGMGDWHKRTKNEDKLEALCRIIAASEVILAHLEALESKDGEVAP
jgi:hypothetical protein